jgi:hypothetical protein
MAIEFSCPACGETLRVEIMAAGRLVRCGGVPGDAPSSGYPGCGGPGARAGTTRGTVRIFGRSSNPVVARGSGTASGFAAGTQPDVLGRHDDGSNRHW